MTTPAEYREFARDCLRWTERARDASERNTLIGISQLWMNAAFEFDRRVRMADDVPALLQQLRAKLD